MDNLAPADVDNVVMSSTTPNLPKPRRYHTDQGRGAGARKAGGWGRVFFILLSHLGQVPSLVAEVVVWVRRWVWMRIPCVLVGHIEVARSKRGVILCHRCQRFMRMERGRVVGEVTEEMAKRSRAVRREVGVGVKRVVVR